MKRKSKFVSCAATEDLYNQVLSYAEKNKMNRSAAVRDLITKGLNDDGAIKTTVTDTIDVDLTRRVERLEAKESKSWILSSAGLPRI